MVQSTFNKVKLNFNVSYVLLKEQVAYIWEIYISLSWSKSKSLLHVHVHALLNVTYQLIDVVAYDIRGKGGKYLQTRGKCILIPIAVCLSINVISKVFSCLVRSF